MDVMGTNVKESFLLCVKYEEPTLNNQSHKTTNGKAKNSNSTSNRFSIIENKWLVIFWVGETIRSAHKDGDTSENIKQVLIWFILLVLRHDSLTLQITLRVKPIISQSADGLKEEQHGSTAYKQTVIGQNVKQQGVFRGETLTTHFLQMT